MHYLFWNSSLKFRREMNAEDLSCSICLGFLLKYFLGGFKPTLFVILSIRKTYSSLLFEWQKTAVIIFAILVSQNLSVVKNFGNVLNVGQSKKNIQDNWWEIGLLKKLSNHFLILSSEKSQKIFVGNITLSSPYVSRTSLCCMTHASWSFNNFHSRLLSA